MDEIIIILTAVVIVAVVLVAVSGIKIVKPYEQAIYMRLGEFVRVLNQGPPYRGTRCPQAGGHHKG